MANKAQTYRVTGPHPVLGHQPGATFKATLSEAHERRLLTAGAIKVVEEAVKTKGEKSSDQKTSETKED